MTAFVVLLCVGGIGAFFSGVWIYAAREHRFFSIPIGALCYCMVIGAFFTSSGQMEYKELMASSVEGEWLVVDNSGGKTIRHWVLKDNYVKSSTQSDGWEFTDHYGNLCKVSGDSYVMQINQPLDEFLKDYKVRYNIPADQRALE
ncbi:hypothetical protein ACFL08_00770 [Patescibacteria group bacterium]